MSVRDLSLFGVRFKLLVASLVFANLISVLALFIINRPTVFHPITTGFMVLLSPVFPLLRSVDP